MGVSDQLLQQQLGFTLSTTDFPNLGSKYRGKVRDTYVDGDRLVLITTDRLSAFDHVLTTLPFKGDLLNGLATFWFRKTDHIVKNHLIDTPDPCVMVAQRAEPYRIEFVVRAYLTGSLWRDYEAGRDPYGLSLPPGLKRDSEFPHPVLTPSTKAPIGTHDEPLSEQQVFDRGLASPKEFAEAKEAALALFAAGAHHAASRGLLFVDTKYEFGRIKGKLAVIDEIHTPDSSRFWRLESYHERFRQGLPQVMLDKENLRQWLITEQGFSGRGTPPPIPDDVRISLSQKYITAFETITATSFAPQPGPVAERLLRNLMSAHLV
jgi:phosphoribosylaminoimidazole-succinocarboxamide synthase